MVAPSQDKLMALYASPWRAGIAAFFLLAVGLGLIFLPFYRATGAVQSPLFSQTPLAVFAFVLLGSFIAYPGFQFMRLILTGRPLVVTDGTKVERMRLGFGRTSIDWAQVGDLGLRGVWIILMDGSVPQSRFTTFMFGARGLWLPGLLVHGGGATTMRFITDHRRDLIYPTLDKARRRR